VTVTRSYVEAELMAARSSISTALIKLRRLVESDEINDEPPDRKSAIRGQIMKLDGIQREIEKL
jgi:hypothetical protein